MNESRRSKTGRVLVCVAWPYANGSLHLGHIAGAYLPADIFARYMRLSGRDVLMVSGSDAHGTPILVRAEQEGVSPQEIVDKYSREFSDLWERLNINFDLFTSTATANHAETVNLFIDRLYSNGYLYTKQTEQYFDEVRRTFLPDRYVEGTCPHCAYGSARGDQCEDCGRPLDPTDLLEPTSKLSGSTPTLKSSIHLFFRLSALQESLKEWIESKRNWRNYVRNWTVGFLDGDVHDRAISRDLQWGIPLSAELGVKDKKVYVWFEAVIGYLSATIEYAKRENVDWRDWWANPETASYYFVGKDNIPFHSVIWPAMLMAHGGLQLPTNVPANNYVLLGGEKASKSSGIGRSAVDYVNLLGSDSLRYALSTVLPEGDDSEITDEILVERINAELANGWGNLISRTFALSRKQLGGLTPTANQLEMAERQALTLSIDSALAQAGAAIEAVQFRKAMRILMSAVQETNTYLSDVAPWSLHKTDPEAASQAVAVTLAAVSGLAVGLSPFLPSSSASVLGAMGIRDSGAQWSRPILAPGVQLDNLPPLFLKYELPLVF